MKRMITASKYTAYHAYQYGKARYSIHYNEVTEGMSSMEAFNAFSANVSKIAPYDDAEYYWARIANGTIEYIQNGKVMDRSYYGTSDDADLENIEWVQSIIDDACENLIDLNKDIKPVIIHN